ncbi:MAG: hypothetical protein MI921_19685 [Cytophagales bacterium]|nr:hypothetical protein [Cytophagales bacterium]
MHKFKYVLIAVVLATAVSCQNQDDADIRSAPNVPEATVDQGLNEALAMEEMKSVMSAAADERGQTMDELTNARRRRFTREQNVFVRNAIAVNDLEDPTKANVTLPLFKGIGPSGNPTYYVLTETSSFIISKLLGVNYAPKLIHGRGSEGSQEVTIQRGFIKFRGDVDFSPVRRVEPGDGPFAFPPSVAEPGSIGDDEYSSLVVLPSGLVINAQIVANSTGKHDRIISIDIPRRRVTMELLDGFQGGDQFYYHLVTDATAAGPAAIELGTLAPRMAKLPAFGQSSLFENTTFIGFSPVTNGETGADNPERQSLSSTILDNDLDPINVFPFDPDNDQEFFNNYSPMWDAHLNMWTQEAIDAGLRRRITSFEDLTELVEAGYVTSFEGSPGSPNPFVANLNYSGAMINCPVIAQPFETEDNSQDGGFGNGF